jgi:hypothetical protein
VRSRAELLAQLQAVQAADVKQAFKRMLSVPPAVAVAGRVRKGAEDRLKALYA